MYLIFKHDLFCGNCYEYTGLKVALHRNNLVVRGVLYSNDMRRIGVLNSPYNALSALIRISEKKTCGCGCGCDIIKEDVDCDNVVMHRYLAKNIIIGECVD